MTTDPSRLTKDCINLQIHQGCSHLDACGTAFKDCGYNYRYNLDVLFPVTNVLEATKWTFFPNCRLQQTQ